MRGNRIHDVLTMYF